MTYPGITITADLATNETVIDMTTQLFHHRAEHRAFMDWLIAIGLDPNDLPASTPLRINRDQTTISGSRYWRDHEGRRRIDDSETTWRYEPFTHDLPDPVPPFPQAVLELANAQAATYPTGGEPVALAQVSDTDRRDRVIDIIEDHQRGPDGFDDLCWPEDHPGVEGNVRWTAAHVADLITAALEENR